MRQKLLLFLFCCFFLAFVTLMREYGSPRTVKDVLNSMPSKEKEILSDFFEELLAHHCFGYTLFGNKPVSIAAYLKNLHSSELLLQRRTSFFLRRGEAVWRKYTSCFELKGFILKFQADDVSSSLLIINKSAFLAKVEEHLEFFKEVLGQKITPATLLAKISREDTSFDAALQFHHGLKGLLFGYGKQNSLLFHRLMEITMAFQSKIDIPLKHCLDDKNFSSLLLKEQNALWRLNRHVSNRKTSRLFPQPGFKDLLQEYRWLNSRLDFSQNIYSCNPLNFFTLPTFRAILEDSETKELVLNYQNDTEKLSHIYSTQAFLEITLQKLTGDVDA